ncbi:MAG: hypothetical protein D6689_00895 [Deltaproteobacteria bacterium]|nr:MAG: hypothetical protein D6689_00895 [Deltaproteobacteria bacterium]
MRRSLALVAAAVLLALAAQPVKSRALAIRAGWPRFHEYVLLPPPSAAPVLAMGFRELAADITWARATVYYGSARPGDPGSYLYLDRFIDNILALDPKFRRPYLWAAYAVTYKHGNITAEEAKQSLHYLERAMKAFPDDGEFYWLAGIRLALYIKGETEEETRRIRQRAAELIEQAVRKPNADPTWATIAADLRSELGQREQAIRELRELILITDNEAARQQLLARLERLVHSVDVANALERAAHEFEEEHQRYLPYAPATLYVLLGPPPPKGIDFARLATERDLISFEPTDAEAEPVSTAEDAMTPPEPGHLADGLGDDAGAVHRTDAGPPR